MQTPGEVVIVDRNNVEHVFQAGFDPKRAAEIVRKQLDAQTPPQEPQTPRSYFAPPSVGELVDATGRFI